MGSFVKKLPLFARATAMEMLRPFHSRFFVPKYGIIVFPVAEERFFCRFKRSDKDVETKCRGPKRTISIALANVFGAQNISLVIANRLELGHEDDMHPFSRVTYYSNTQDRVLA